MAIGYRSRFGSVRCLRCPNRYARNIVIANMRQPTGMATPIPVLVELGSPEKAAEGLALNLAFGTELVAEGSVIEEDSAAGSDLMLVELFAVAVFTALLESVVVVAELVKKLPGVAVVNPLGVSVRLY